MTEFSGLIFGDFPHYLDHLAPFCALHNCPLYISDSHIAELARKYYPDLKVIESLPKKLDVALSCQSREFLPKCNKLLWLPHGNSDKGWQGPIYEPLQNEIALVYGQQMIDAMHKEHVFPKIIRVGNFRLAYWKKHQDFYHQFPLPRGKKTYLYAPTWDDAEGNGSLMSGLDAISTHLPKECNLIVKIHPNSMLQFAPEIERMIGKWGCKANIFFLTSFPPIYALLSICDIYIGDMSSIGYDFLYWKRPMYFFKRNGPSLLHQAGKLALIPEIFHEDPQDRREIQTQIYNYAFDGSTKTTFMSLISEAVGSASIS